MGAMSQRCAGETAIDTQKSLCECAALMTQQLKLKALLLQLVYGRISGKIRVS